MKIRNGISQITLLSNLPHAPTRTTATKSRNGICQIILFRNVPHAPSPTTATKFRNGIRQNTLFSNFPHAQTRTTAMKFINGIRQITLSINVPHAPTRTTVKKLTNGICQITLFGNFPHAPTRTTACSTAHVPTVSAALSAEPSSGKEASPFSSAKLATVPNSSAETSHTSSLAATAPTLLEAAKSASSAHGVWCLPSTSYALLGEAQIGWHLPCTWWLVPPHVIRSRNSETYIITPRVSSAAALTLSGGSNICKQCAQTRYMRRQCLLQ